MALSTRKMIRTLANLIALAALVIAGSSVLASVASAEENLCPKLTQTKYPFITCEANSYGGVTLRMPNQPPPLACHQLMPDGDCAASPWIWQLPIPRFGKSL